MPHSTNTPSAERRYGDFRDQLFQDGYVVVRGVVSKERAEGYVNEMYNWLEKFPLGFDRNDCQTWTEEHLPAHMKGGMYHGYAVSHEKFVWDARQEPGVLSAFSKVWGTSDLLSSFDGINFTLPPPGPPAGPSTPWEHVDQAPELKGMQCIQGILNLCPNGPQDGGLMVMKGSHKLCEKFFDVHGRERKPEWGNVPEDWFGFDKENIQWFEKHGASVVKVNAEPGDLLLWDSRTVHWNVKPMEKQIRAAIYVCYTPAGFATEEDLAKKKRIFEARDRTTHWPHRNFWKADKILRFGKEDPYHRDRPFEEPVSSERLLKLAGAIPYTNI